MKKLLSEIIFMPEHGPPKKRKGRAERFEDWVSHHIGSILYVIGSIIWAIILIALLTKGKE